MKKTLLFVLTLSGLSVLSANIIKDYRYVTMLKTWAEAQSYCRETFADLATVRNGDENDRLLSVLQGSGKYAWIGLYDDRSRWRWTLGNVINKNTGFTNWNASEPVSYPSKRRCTMMEANGLWYHTHSCYERHPSVCYDEQGLSKYILVQNETSWYKAREYCRSNYTDLARAKNISENNDIASLLSVKTWIGLSRKPWVYWSDRKGTTFKNWENGQPDNNGDTIESCAVVDTTTGTWWDADCKAKHHFICQKVRVRHKTSFKLKFQSEANLNDPAIQKQVLEQLHAKLEKHGLPDFKLRWIQTDGQTFHKEQKRKEEEGSGG